MKYLSLFLILSIVFLNISYANEEEILDMISMCEKAVDKGLEYKFMYKNCDFERTNLTNEIIKIKNSEGQDDKNNYWGYFMFASGGVAVGVVLGFITASSVK